MGGFHSRFHSGFEIFFNIITLSRDGPFRLRTNVNPYTSTAVALKLDARVENGLFIVVQDTEDTGLRDTIRLSVEKFLPDDPGPLFLFLDIQHQVCRRAAVYPSKYEFRLLRQAFSTGALRPLQELNTLLDTDQALIQTLRGNQNVMISLRDFLHHYGHMLGSDHAGCIGPKYISRLAELTNKLQTELYVAELNCNQVSSVKSNAGWPPVLTKKCRFSIRSRTFTI